MVGTTGNVTDDEDDADDDDVSMASLTSQGGSTSAGASDDKHKYREEWWLKFCRGDHKPRRPDGDRMLFCHDKNIPLLGRNIRVEVLSIQPPIYILKDVLTDHMMQQFIAHASEEMQTRIHSYTTEDGRFPPINLVYFLSNFAVTLLLLWV